MNNKSESELKADVMASLHNDLHDYQNGNISIGIMCERIAALLQKLCEEQKGEIERLKALGLGGTIQDILQNSDRLYSQLAEKDNEIERLKKANLCSWCGSNDLVCGKAWKDERDGLKSQLAEQTERVRVMGQALRQIKEHCQDSIWRRVAEQALKQEDSKMSPCSCDCAVLRERVRVLEKELASMIGSHGEPCADLNRGMGDCSAVKSAKQALHPTSKGEDTGCGEGK